MKGEVWILLSFVAVLSFVVTFLSGSKVRREALGRTGAQMCHVQPSGPTAAHSVHVHLDPLG